jgi:hypothetical protein
LRSSRVIGERFRTLFPPRCASRKGDRVAKGTSILLVSSSKPLNQDIKLLETFTVHSILVRRERGGMQRVLIVKMIGQPGVSQPIFGVVQNHCYYVIRCKYMQEGYEDDDRRQCAVISMCQLA